MANTRAGMIQGSFDSVRFRFKTVRLGFFPIRSGHIEDNLCVREKVSQASTIPLSNDKERSKTVYIIDIEFEIETLYLGY